MIPRYIVHFVGGISEEILAENFEEAIILACAVRIQKGHSYNIHRVVCHETGKQIRLNPYPSVQINHYVPKVSPMESTDLQHREHKRKFQRLDII